MWWDCGASRWYMSSEDFANNKAIKNVRPANGHVGGAFGNENKIVNAGELDTKIGEITVYQVQQLADNLASVCRFIFCLLGAVGLLDAVDDVSRS